MKWLVKRSLALSGHRTSVALEPAFWEALTAIAAARGESLAALVTAVDRVRDPAHPLASALRVYALGAVAGNDAMRREEAAQGEAPAR